MIFKPLHTMPAFKPHRSESRLTAISRALVFAFRHGPEKLGVELDENGWAPLGHLLSKSDRLNSLSVREQDVRDIIADPEALKLRLECKMDAEIFTVRTYQGHGVNSGVSVHTDPGNQFLAKPGFLLHATTMNALKPILTSGIKRMQRNAIHLVPSDFNSTQEQYVERRKTPIVLVIDAQRAMTHGSQSFFSSPNGAILCDDNEEGVIPTSYIAAVFVYEFPRGSQPILSRLDLDAAKNGRIPTPYYSGAQ